MKTHDELKKELDEILKKAFRKEIVAFMEKYDLYMLYKIKWDVSLACKIIDKKMETK